MRKSAFFAYAKRKTQISCADIAQLISAFVFAILIDHYVNVVVIINFSQKSSVFTLIIISSP